jgi:hypothetical protein
MRRKRRKGSLASQQQLVDRARATITNKLLVVILCVPIEARSLPDTVTTTTDDVDQARNDVFAMDKAFHKK